MKHGEDCEEEVEGGREYRREEREDWRSSHGDLWRPGVKNFGDFKYDGNTMVGSNAQGDVVLFTVHKHKLLFVGETVGCQNQTVGSK